jgi:hypothetical protein
MYWISDTPGEDKAEYNAAGAGAEIGYFLFVLYQVASATASPKYVVLLLFSKKSVFLKIKVAVFLYMFYC